MLQLFEFENISNLVFLFLFFLQTKENTEEPEKQPITMSTTSNKPFTTTISLAIHETCSFLAEFHPNTVGKLNADFSLSIMNNPFEDTTVQLIGECNQEEVTIENIQSSYVATSELALEYNNVENEGCLFFVSFKD